MKINPLSVVSFANIFFHYVGHVFILFMISFALQELLRLSFLKFFILFSLFQEVDQKRYCCDIDLRVLYIFPTSFIESDFIFRFSICFVFIFVCDVKEYYNFIPLNVFYVYILCSVQLSSVAQSCLTFCDPMNHSTPGLPVHHQLPEFTQTHVHQVHDVILPSHPHSSHSPPAPTPPRIRVFSNESTLHMRWPNYWSFSLSII